MKEAILREIGMTDYEVTLYLTLLKQGPLSAYALAEKAGLYRQVTYDALNRLVEKGFVNSVKEGNSQLFKAIDPQLILEYLNEKKDRFENILPELKHIEKESQDTLQVETYKGKNVMRIALRDIINTLKDKGGEVWCTAIDESIPMAKNRSLCEQYERDIIRYNIKERVIIKEGNKGIFSKGNSHYKRISPKYFNQNPVQIYGDTVQIIVWGNPDYVIIIRNKEVADSYRRQFELLWSVAKK